MAPGGAAALLRPSSQGGRWSSRTWSPTPRCLSPGRGGPPLAAGGFPPLPRAPGPGPRGRGEAGGRGGGGPRPGRWSGGRDRWAPRPAVVGAGPGPGWVPPDPDLLAAGGCKRLSVWAARSLLSHAGHWPGQAPGVAETPVSRVVNTATPAHRPHINSQQHSFLAKAGLAFPKKPAAPARRLARSCGYEGAAQGWRKRCSRHGTRHGTPVCPPPGLVVPGGRREKASSSGRRWCWPGAVDMRALRRGGGNSVPCREHCFHPAWCLVSFEEEEAEGGVRARSCADMRALRRGGGNSVRHSVHDTGHRCVRHPAWWCLVPA